MCSCCAAACTPAGASRARWSCAPLARHVGHAAAAAAAAAVRTHTRTHKRVSERPRCAWCSAARAMLSLSSSACPSPRLFARTGGSSRGGRGSDHARAHGGTHGRPLLRRAAPTATPPCPGLPSAVAFAFKNHRALRAQRARLLAPACSLVACPHPEYPSRRASGWRGGDTAPHAVRASREPCVVQFSLFALRNQLIARNLHTQSARRMAHMRISHTARKRHGSIGSRSIL